MESEPAHAPSQSTDVDVMKEAAHVFRDTEVDWGFCNFVEPNILRPGSYCDKEFNLVVKVRIRLHTNGNNGNGNKKVKITLKSEDALSDLRKLDVDAGAEESAIALAAFLVNYEPDVVASKSYEDMRDKLAHTFKAKYINVAMFKEGNKQQTEWLTKTILENLKEVCEEDAMVSLEFSLLRFLLKLRAVNQK